MPSLKYLNENKFNGKHLDYRRVYVKDSYSIISYVRTQMTNVYEVKGETIIEGYVQNIDDVIKNHWEFETVNFMNNVMQDHIFGAYMEDGQLIFANEQFRIHNNIPIAHYKISELKQLSEQQWNDIVRRLKMNESYKYSINYTDKETGKTSYFDCVSYLTKDTFGTKYIWNYWSNTTKQKYAENERKRTKHLMNTVLDNMPISVFIKNPDDDFKYIYWNKVSAQYYLIHDDEPSGKTDFNIFPQESAEQYRAQDIQLYDTGMPVRLLQKYINDEGETRSVDVLKVLLKNDIDNSSLIIGLGWDITELKKIEQELTAAKLKTER